MAHVCEKLTLEPAGLLGAFEEQLDLRVFALHNYFLLLRPGCFVAKLASALFHGALQADPLLTMPALANADV